MRRTVAFDWALFILGLLLSLSGLVYVYSATWRPVEPPQTYWAALLDRDSTLFVFTKQLLAFVVSLVVFRFVRRINWGLKPGTWLWFFVPAVLLLLIVLIPGAGQEHYGAQRWIALGPLDIQPSEFAKLAFILILAWLYSEPERLRLPRRYFAALGILVALLALVALQPDLGTAMVFVCIFFVMSIFARVPWKLIGVVLLYMVWLALLAWHFALHDYQRDRLRAFLNPESDPAGRGYHIIQSEIAVGSGGWTGKGFLRGTQVRGGFLPVVESDFVFALVAEEFGFIGCFYLLLLYFLLLARILALSRDARTHYERYICYGTSAVIFFHVFVGAGMTVGLTPITGLPLPFVSQGGTSLLTMWLLLAINASVYANSRR